VRGSTKIVGLIGGADQVRSSLSPAMHNAVFESLGLDWAYIPLPLSLFAKRATIRLGTVERKTRPSPEDVGSNLSMKTVLQGLASAGIRGVNVTMPYKLDAAAAVDSLEGNAKAIGAVNTINFLDGRMVGWNTDGDGLLSFLRKDVGATIKGKPAVVIGSGGAARAVVVALSQAGASSITAAVRDPSHAEELVDLAGKTELEVVRLGGRRKRWLKEASLIINATPVGQKGEPPPVPTKDIRRGAVVVDLVYNPPTTPLIEGSRAQGAVAHNGLGMLLHQAALSFEIWTGVQPPLEDMSAAALAELRP
jgi:shikimate dehydrogenase